MTNRVSIILSVFLLALCGYMMVTFLEYYTEEKDLGWSREALQNPFLAAQLYREQQGATVLSADSYLKLDDLYSYDTLYLTDSNLILSDERLQELLEWVQDGGHVVAGVSPASEQESNRLLEYFEFGVEKTGFDPSLFGDDFFDDLGSDDEPGSGSDASSESGRRENSDTASPPSETSKSSRPGKDRELTDQQRREAKARRFEEQMRKFNDAMREQGLVSDDAKPKTLTEKIAAYEAKIPADDLTQLSFQGVDSQLYVLFDRSIELDHPAFYEGWEADSYKLDYWRSSQYGVQFAQVSYGDGLVSVMAGTRVFDSNNIGHFDNAYLWEVLSGDAIAILYGSNMPTLWFMVRTFLPEILLAFSLFTLLWVWHSAQRFGPVREPAITVRRSFAEHIAAAAGFYWRQNWQPELLAPAREDIIKRAEARLAGYLQASEGKRIKLLAQECGLDETLVVDAMSTSQKLNEEAFTRVVKTLQRIREKL